MADGTRHLTGEIYRAIADIDAQVWDSLANPDAAFQNPFVSHAFLKALETSSSVGPGTGWSACHIAVKDGDETVGVAPSYLKENSSGEYIFDHHWADAYGRAGGQYYPKLLCAVPFTPVAGPRLLAKDDASRLALAEMFKTVCANLNCSSLHINFVGATDFQTCQQQEFLSREGTQYHWFNHDFKTFDDFLAQLSSRKRKAIRRERRMAVESGLTIRHLTGDQASEEDWNAFWHFYQDTGARKWGRPYLTRSFFRDIARSMPDQLLLVLADRDGQPVAGALNLVGGDAIYGRYWGCSEHHPFLHFEVCYHQAIDYAIEHGLARVEAGAQGEHKIARGYEPIATRSVHWIPDAGFRDAIARYLESERRHNQAEIDMLRDYTPFKKDPK